MSSASSETDVFCSVLMTLTFLDFTMAYFKVYFWTIRPFLAKDRNHYCGLLWGALFVKIIISGVTNLLNCCAIFAVHISLTNVPPIHLSLCLYFYPSSWFALQYLLCCPSSYYPFLQNVQDIPTYFNCVYNIWTLPYVGSCICLNYLLPPPPPI